MGYLRDRVRNGGAAECGLSPVRAMGVATRASGAQQLFSAPFQLCLFGHCELRNNRAGNRDNGQLDRGMHGFGTSLNKVTPSELFRKRGFSASPQRAPETIIAAGKALIHIFANRAENGLS